MARFVVLNHKMPAGSQRDDHFDLMLESSKDGNPVLATWETAQWPPRSGQTATRLPDHRIAYLNREGELSGDRGTVCRRDQGTLEYELVEEQTWVVRLHGKLFAGQIQLQKKHPASPNDQCWELSLEPVANAADSPEAD